MKLEEIRGLMEKLPSIQTPMQERFTQDMLIHMGLEPGSIYQELEMSSRFVDTHRDTSYSNTAVNLHSHAFYEVICCRNTCDVEYLVGAERYRLQRGDVIVVPPGVSHRPLLPEVLTEPYTRDVLWISEEFIQFLSQNFSGDIFTAPAVTSLVRTAGTQWEFLMEKFHQGVLEAEEKKPGWQAAVMANTMQLIVQLRRAARDRSAPALRAEKKELLDQVLEYIEENLAGKITLADAAHRFFVSESTISQLFRRKMGVSFYRCVTQRRLIAAKSLIGSNIPLEDVSRRVGFADYSSFYRAFKQEYGISPRQYRKLQESSVPEE